jgi:adenine-specific DNA-methyltransferase
MIHRIIEISTDKNDIILDYHLGTGTTCVVAQKMGRQYIGIEQMDYIEDIAVERMKKVLEGEQGGISKSVEWKSGGDFVYMEIKKYNRDFIDKIKKADRKELKEIFKIMKEQAFLSYRFSEKEFNEKVSDFENLDLENQKKVLVEILDKNQLYLNLSEIEDKKFGVSREDKEINNSFYNK